MDMFKKNYIFFDVDVKSKEDAISFIATKANELGISNDSVKTEDDLWYREKEFSTAIDENIAIPHTKSPSINFPAILIIKTKNKIDWDGENVKVLISFLTPQENEDNIHLTMLSKVSRKLVDEDFKDTLIKSNDVDLIYEMLNETLNS